MADFDGTEPSPHLRRLITEHRLGGVVLFQKNIQNPAQVAHLCRELQHLARQAGLPLLLIAMDQEGGPVERLPLGLPGAMAIGATRSAAFAETAGGITGRALRAVGVNINFAPVLDVNTNPANPVIGLRSFGEEPDLVSRLGRAFIAGLHQEGVAATGKHFPGHGDADLDSHAALPVVRHAIDRLEAVEFHPFRQAIQDGLGAVMTAHVAFTHADTAPATLSPAILQRMLREGWGFDGVVFTDSLAMAPIARIGAGRAAVQALLAGADVLLACGGPRVQEEVIGSVRQAAEQGVLSIDRLGQSRRRLVALRARMLRDAPRVDEAERIVGNADDLLRAREIAEHAVTLVRDEAHNVPLQSGQLRVLTLAPATARVESTLGEILRRFRPLDDLVLRSGDEVDPAVVAGDPLIIVTHNRGRPDPWQIEVVRRAHESADRRLIVVTTGTPYDLTSLPPVPTYLATYGREPVMLMAAARVLAGEIPPRGRLPVGIPGRYPVGHGIVW